MIILLAILLLAFAAFIVLVVLKISSQVNERLNQMNQSIQEANKIIGQNLGSATEAFGNVKEQKMDLILQKLTELGVSRIIPVSMERSIVKLDKERFNKKKVRWESICKEASEQSKRTNIPIIEDIKSIKDLTKEDADLKLVASTKEKEKLLNYYLQSIEDCAKIIMVIGPEGGISDKEEDILVSNGYNRVSFGNLIFRVETATIYVASIINYISSRS
jgi:16S rRNA (uracil1498-N3)-methyltransferase